MVQDWLYIVKFDSQNKNEIKKEFTGCNKMKSCILRTLYYLAIAVRQVFRMSIGGSMLTKP